MSSGSTLPLKVLVSGSSGYIAVWVVRAILERGHYVRGTVRTPAKGEYLRRTLKDHGGERFSYVIVEDMQKEGAFDEAVQGMDAVVHTASPVVNPTDRDPEELIRPAVDGTISILESTRKFGLKVKRVIITSSTAAVTEWPPETNPPTSLTFTEKNWNEQSVQIVREKGRNAGEHIYRASKTLAEKAAWEYIDTHKGEVQWDLATIQPTFVFGPLIHEVPSVDQLNTSCAIFLAFLLNKPSPFGGQLPSFTASQRAYVDVRDVAWAHAEALTNDSMANRDKETAFVLGKGRTTLGKQEFTWGEVVSALTAGGISLPPSTPRPDPNAPSTPTFHSQIVDSTFAREVLGLQFRSLTETFGDSLAYFRERGWVE